MALHRHANERDGRCDGGEACCDGRDLRGSLPYMLQETCLTLHAQVLMLCMEFYGASIEQDICAVCFLNSLRYFTLTALAQQTAIVKKNEATQERCSTLTAYHNKIKLN